MGDGFPSDEDISATFSADKVVGDIYPVGADHPGHRIINTRGGGLLTTNSDPNVVGIDPITGASAAVGTDVGFAAPIRRFVHTGVLNGDFAQAPLSASEPISDSNALPYWTLHAGSDSQVTWVATSAAASGGSLVVTPNGPGAALDEVYIEQLVPIPASAGQQYRALGSVYIAFSGATSKPFLRWQYLAVDATTTVGSETTSQLISGAGPGELKVDMGLVPPTAAYARIRVGVLASFSSTYPFYEARVAFLPAEATVGLKSITSAVTGITTTETTVASILIPANTLTPGSVYTIRAYGTCTSSAAVLCTFRLRMGTALLTGSLVVSSQPTSDASNMDEAFRYEGLVTVRSVGSSGTVTGGLFMADSNTGPFGSQTKVDQGTGTLTIDTTVARYLELTAETAAGTCTLAFRQAVITCDLAS